MCYHITDKITQRYKEIVHGNAEAIDVKATAVIYM